MIFNRKSWPYFSHYISLASILGIGFSLLAFFNFNKEAQAYVIVITSVAYAFWGVIHHKLVHYLTGEIVAEYILVAALGSLVLLSLVGTY
jgi:hypothetical protein